MKKHELLKYAYDNYPKGAMARFKGVDIDHVSTGKFKVFYDRCEDGLCVTSGNGTECFYSNGEWAEIIPESEPLKLEKIAVKVNNEREFKLLMKHYDELGFVNGRGGDNSFSPNNYPIAVPYEQAFWIRPISGWRYSLVDFDFFCDQKGITIPKPILTSVDGVELFEGDDYYRACNIAEKGVWTLITIGGSDPTSGKISRNRLPASNERFFSTKEAVEKWISEQNKPKEISIAFDYDYTPNNALVHIMGVHLRNGENVRYCLSGEELEKVYEAYKSLQ